MWSVRAEDPYGADGAALLRAYMAEVIARYNGRPATAEEVDKELRIDPPTGLVAFLVLRLDGEAAGCAGLRPDGELTKVFVDPRFRRRGGARFLVRAVEATARELGIARLRLDTRTDLTEARALYAAEGFAEVPAFSDGPYADHWFEKHLQP